MKTSVPISDIEPETTDVSELFSMTSILSTSLVKRLIVSPVGVLSKYLTGSFISLLKRSFLIFSVAFCDTESISLLCRYVDSAPSAYTQNIITTADKT